VSYDLSPAELRTISLDCDSDLFMQTYNASHRKLSLSSHSPATSCYSDNESQQSSRSLYDNVDGRGGSESKDKVAVRISSNYLMPPMLPLRSSLVNRSKSFQEAGPCRKHLSPRSNILLRRNLQQSNRIEDRFYIWSSRSPTPVGSTLSESNVNCIETFPDVENRALVVPKCSCDKRNSSNGPFYVKILRRLQKLSLQWRKCKKVPRGRSLVANYGFLIIV
jgi:hypothetical protein